MPQFPKHMHRFHADTIASVVSELKRCQETLVRADALVPATQLGDVIASAEERAAELKSKSRRSPPKRSRK